MHRFINKPLLTKKNELLHNRVAPTVKVIVRPNKIIPLVMQPVPVSPPARTISRQIISQKIIRQPVPHVPITRYHTAPLSPEYVQRLYDIRSKGTGKVLVIFGNGPSLNELDPTPLLHNPKIELMSINRPDLRVWPTTYWAFCDTSQYNRYQTYWQTYEGLIINSNAIQANKPNQVKIRNMGGYGFSRDIVQGYHVGRSTVYANMQTAMWMDYARTYILGIDMSATGIDGAQWFYGVNQDVKLEARGPRFAQEATYYQHAATNCLNATERARYWFCSSYNTHSFTEAYNKLDHLIAINHILEYAATL